MGSYLSNFVTEKPVARMIAVEREVEFADNPYSICIDPDPMIPDKPPMEVTSSFIVIDLSVHRCTRDFEASVMSTVLSK